MKNTFNKIKEKISGLKEDYDYDEYSGDYIEVEEVAKTNTPNNSSIVIKPFSLGDFADIKPILDSLREGVTIALINIRPLRDRDIVELKRAVNKLKKTCDAMEGDIAGFGEDWIIATPSFAYVHRNKDISTIESDNKQE